MKKVIGYLLPIVVVLSLYYFLEAIFGINLLCFGCYGPEYKDFYPFPIYIKLESLHDMLSLERYTYYFPGIVYDILTNGILYVVYIYFYRKSKYSIVYSLLASVVIGFALLGIYVFAKRIF